MSSIQSYRIQAVQSRFHSAMAVGRKLDLKFDQQMMKVMGYSLDVLPESKTFDSWSPDPWTIVGTNGANLVTVSQIGLTVTKAQIIGGGVVLTYYLNMNTQTHGWTVVALSTPPRDAQLRLDFSNAQGGLIWSEYPNVEMSCGTNKPEYASNRIAVDIYDLIAGAHLSMPQQTF
jgi:hypothetical protein